MYVTRIKRKPLSPPSRLAFVHSHAHCWVVCRSESSSSEEPTPPRTGFHYSEKYCPVTGPERPPPRQDLLTASFKLTSLLTPSLARSASGAGIAGGEANRDSGHESGDAGDGETERWADSKGAARRPAVLTGAGLAGAAAMASSTTDQRSPTLHRRVGTYEREREKRGLVLHYLTVATTPQPTKVTPSNDADETSSSAATASKPSHPDGATAAALLTAMRERPWEGRPNAGTPQEWEEWLKHLEPTLERHLRWLTVDGLASRSNADWDDPANGKREARFVAELPDAERDEEGTEAGGTASAGRLHVSSSGGKVVAAGGAGGQGAGAFTAAAGLSMFAGGMRIMKSRPIKMVKPWR